MASFDVVNKLDMQHVDNAVNNTKKKISQRYDFKGVEVNIELNKNDKTLKIEVPDDMKLRHVKEILNSCLFDQDLSTKVIAWGDNQDASLGTIRVVSPLRDGLDKDMAKKVVKLIKDSGLKVKSSIQGDQVRVDGKKIDDLQDVIQLLKNADLDSPLQFVNMKR